MAQNKEKALILLNEMLEKANEEEMEVLVSVLEGLRKKQNNEVRTYIGGFTHMKSRPLENGEFEVTMPIQKLIENPLGMVHGGLTATLLDNGMGFIIHHQLPEDETAVTVEMKIQYIKPGIGKELRCVSRILHKGSKLCYCEAKVFNDEGDLIANGTGTFFIIKKRT